MPDRDAAPVAAEVDHRHTFTFLRCGAIIRYGTRAQLEHASELSAAAREAARGEG